MTEVLESEGVRLISLRSKRYAIAVEGLVDEKNILLKSVKIFGGFGKCLYLYK